MSLKISKNILTVYIRDFFYSAFFTAKVFRITLCDKDLGSHCIAVTFEIKEMYCSHFESKFRKNIPALVIKITDILNEYKN